MHDCTMCTCIVVIEVFMKCKQVDIAFMRYKQISYSYSVAVCVWCVICEMREIRTENGKMKSTQIKNLLNKTQNQGCDIRIGMWALNDTDRRRKCFKCRKHYDNKSNQQCESSLILDANTKKCLHSYRFMNKFLSFLFDFHQTTLANVSQRTSLNVAR